MCVGARYNAGYAGRECMTTSTAPAVYLTQGQMNSNIETQVFANREKVKQLRDEHRDLDLAIAEMARSSHADQFMLSRMKKRKLRIKDMIARLESERIPDLNA